MKPIHHKPVHVVVININHRAEIISAVPVDSNTIEMESAQSIFATSIWEMLSQ
jgi:hypothetical protein